MIYWSFFASFEHLCDRFSLPRHHFRFLHVCSFVRSPFPSFSKLSDPTALDNFLTPTPSLKGAISSIYDEICQLRPESLNSIKTRWEKIFQRIFGRKFCQFCLFVQDTLFYNLRWYIGLVTPSLGCLRSMTVLRQQSPAKHILMFWLWPSIQTFWMQIFNSLGYLGKTWNQMR